MNAAIYSLNVPQKVAVAKRVDAKLNLVAHLTGQLRRNVSGCTTTDTIGNVCAAELRAVVELERALADLKAALTEGARL